MKDVKIENSKKENLHGILYEGHDEDRKKSLIILCHGFMGNKNNCFFPELSEELNKIGYSTFRFDFSGYGDSEGKFEENTISKNVEGIKTVVDHFKKEGYEIISVLGHSMGGTSVLAYKSKYNEVKSIIVISPRIYNKKAVEERYSKEQLDKLETDGFFDYEANKKTYRISKEFIEDRTQNYSDVRNQAKNIKCPVLLIHGEADKTTPDKESRDLIKVLSKKSMLKLIPDEDHNFSNKENIPILFNTINAFLFGVQRGIF